MEGTRKTKIIALLISILLFGCQNPSSLGSQPSETSIEYHENGMLESIGLLEGGKKQGTWKYYDERGILLREIDYLNDQIHGQYKEYRKGYLVWHEQFEKNKREGPAQYYESACGTLTKEGYHKENRQDSLWYHYNNCMLVNISLYSIGELKETLFTIDSSSSFQDGPTTSVLDPNPCCRSFVDEQGGMNLEY